MSVSVKSINREDIQILAPAGSFESLHAAIQGGADAVYFGVGSLNMRSRSSGNFSLDSLKDISEICRENNIRAHLTVNTLMYDEDMPALEKIISEAAKHGITAVIASDIAAVEYARRMDVEVHMSTQMNIGNIEAVRFYSRFADVMVLARELNLDQVKNISAIIDKENITGPSGRKVRIEVFIHGALCMAISGKCYLSLHESGHSANRGACLQICRRAYTVKEKETGRELEVDNEYIMSPKDLCTIHFLNKIIDAGVTVLKIEGRARSPEYVKTVTESYSEAVDAIINGSYSKEKTDKWQDKLSTVFNRGFWDGYYLGQKLGEWSQVYGSKATRKKIYAGKATNYYSKIGVAEFLIETGSLQEGDEVLIIGPTTGVINLELKEIRNDIGRTKKVTRGENCAFRVDSEVRRSDKLYRLEKRI
ncbi:MAG: peptidase U32 family protein [Bacteroidales bacterium]